MATTEYASTKAHSARVQKYKEGLKQAIKQAVQGREAFREMLLAEGTDVFTHEEWKGVAMEPLHIVFLPTLPTAMRFKHRPVSTEIMPKLKDQLDSFKKQGYRVKFTGISHYGVPLVVLVVLLDS